MSALLQICFIISQKLSKVLPKEVGAGQGRAGASKLGRIWEWFQKDTRQGSGLQTLAFCIPPNQEHVKKTIYPMESQVSPVYHNTRREQPVFQKENAQTWQGSRNPCVGGRRDFLAWPCCLPCLESGQPWHTPTLRCLSTGQYDQQSSWHRNHKATWKAPVPFLQSH